MSDATAVPGVLLSPTLATNLVTRFAALRPVQPAHQPVASTSTLPPNTKQTVKELGNGVTSPSRKRGRGDEDLAELVEAEEREQHKLIAHLNQSVLELDAIKPAPHPTSTVDIRLALLRQEESLLRAELAALRQATRPPPVTDTAVPDPTEASLAALDRTVAELELARARAEKSLARDESLLAKDEVLLADATTLNEALHARLEAKREQAGDKSPEHLLARTQARATRIAAAFGSLMAALVQLIDERLAASGDVGGDEGMDEEEDVYEGSEDSSDADEEERKDKRRKRVAKRRRPTRLGFETDTSIRAYFAAPPDAHGDEHQSGTGPRTPADKAQSLKLLLENLMNAAVGSEPNSWLGVRAPPGSLPEEAAEYYPPELVDFLLRAGVVTEKAGEQGKVRLVDFGGSAEEGGI